MASELFVELPTLVRHAGDVDVGTCAWRLSLFLLLGGGAGNGGGSGGSGGSGSGAAAPRRLLLAEPVEAPLDATRTS